MPQARFWIAMASENSTRAQPNSAATGIWNTPKLARIAKDSIRTTQPAIRMGVIRGDLVIAGSCRRAKRCAGRRAGSTGEL